MFIGHFAVGFAMKLAAPRTNLGWLIAAPIFLDLIWPIFVLAGLERVEVEPGNTAFTPLNFVHYPISHSLAATVGWSIAAAAVYLAVSKYRTGALVVGLGVLSHWVLDAGVHRPDLPLYPGGQMVGLGLWNSVGATLAIECLMFAVGVWIYARMTKPVDKIGSIGFWAFVLFIAVIYAGNVFGPPPPNATAVASVTLAMWILPFWAGWFDRHRETAE
jgi:hypothetical protein